MKETITTSPEVINELFRLVEIYALEHKVLISESRLNEWTMEFVSQSIEEIDLFNQLVIEAKLNIESHV